MGLTMKILRGKMPRDLLILLIVYGVLSILPAFFHGNLAMMGILIMCVIWAVVAVNWDLIMGHAGVFTFANVALFVIGAYASAMLTTQLGISPWLGMLISGFVAAAIGVAVALPCLRLKGTYIALITFALHMILGPFITSDIGRAIGTGGCEGFIFIPTLAVRGYTFSSFELVPWFYLAMGISFLSLIIIYKIIHSSWGLGFVAIRDSQPFAESLGLDNRKYTLIVFAITSFFTGMIGAFYAHYVGILSTRILGLDLFLMLMVMQVVGGMGRFPGSLIGAIIVTLLNEQLRAVGVYRLVIFGAIIVTMVVLLPDGIMGILLPTSGLGFRERFGRFTQQTFRRRPSRESIEK